MEIIAYLDALDLYSSAPLKSFRSVPPVESAILPVFENKAQSFFSEKSIVSFASEVHEQTRNDILNATLLAQLAANNLQPDHSKLIEWYTAFIDVLSKTGWIIEGGDVQLYHSESELIEVEKIVIDILTSAFGAGYISIIQNTLDAIKKLNHRDQKLKAFERNVSKVSKGCFQITLATETDGLVSMRIGTFMLNSVNKITSVLFFKTSKDKTTLEYLSKNATFNGELYSQIREKVTEKLGQHLLNSIAEINIS